MVEFEVTASPHLEACLQSRLQDDCLMACVYGDRAIIHKKAFLKGRKPTAELVQARLTEMQSAWQKIPDAIAAAAVEAAEIAAAAAEAANDL
jgi:hypothetical protein